MGKSMSSKKKQSVGQDIIEGLSELCEAVKNKVPLQKQFTIRDVELDLRPRPYDAASVKKTRTLFNVSQAVFAEMLGASKESVQKWEQGYGKPSRVYCRLLEIMNSEKDNWFNVLERSVSHRGKSHA